MVLETIYDYVEFAYKNERDIVEPLLQLDSYNANLVNSMLVKAIKLLEEARKVNINDLYDVYNFVHNIDFSKEKIEASLEKVPSEKRNVLDLYKTNKEEAIKNLIYIVGSSHAFTLDLVYYNGKIKRKD